MDSRSSGTTLGEQARGQRSGDDVTMHLQQSAERGHSQLTAVQQIGFWEI